MISIVKAHSSTELPAQSLTEEQSRPWETWLKLGLIKLHTSCSHSYLLNFYYTLQPNVQLVQAWKDSRHGQTPTWLFFRIVTKGLRWSQQRESLICVFTVFKKKIRCPLPKRKSKHPCFLIISWLASLCCSGDDWMTLSQRSQGQTSL